MVDPTKDAVTNEPKSLLKLLRQGGGIGAICTAIYFGATQIETLRSDAETTRGRHGREISRLQKQLDEHKSEAGHRVMETRERADAAAIATLQKQLDEMRDSLRLHLFSGVADIPHPRIAVKIREIELRVAALEK